MGRKEGGRGRDSEGQQLKRGRGIKGVWGLVSWRYGECYAERYPVG